jgi:hypothetical protein
MFRFAVDGQWHSPAVIEFLYGPSFVRYWL